MSIADIHELGGYPYDRDPGRPGWFATLPEMPYADFAVKSASMLRRAA